MSIMLIEVVIVNDNDSIKIVADQVDFKTAAIKAALENLSKKVIITNVEKDKLLKIYLNDNRQLNILFDELSSLTKEEVNKELNKIINEEKSQKIKYHLI